MILTFTWEEKDEYKFGAQRRGTLYHKYYPRSSLDFQYLDYASGVFF